MAEPMTITLRDGDQELEALSHLVSIIERFDHETRERMLWYLCERFPKTIVATELPRHS